MSPHNSVGVIIPDSSVNRAKTSAPTIVNTQKGANMFNILDAGMMLGK